ncbi:MAG: ABC transporter permease [Ktedonobacteraceae bacterium]|nr:ABC transporter permease [Ktedonobacteraceae bacterium]
MGSTPTVKTRSQPIYDSSLARGSLLYAFTELMRYRFLLWSLIVKDLKVRYKRSSLGLVWVMLHPLLTMTVLAVVFSQVFQYNIKHFTVYLLSGTLLWNLYAQGTAASMANLQGNGPILRKLYVPPSVFVASAIGSALVNFVFTLVPLLLLTLADGILPAWSWLFLIVPALLATLFSLGLGLIVASLVVFFTDTYEIYQVIVMAYYFLTPIFYPANILPQPLRALELYNPMYLFIASFRTVLIQGTLPSPNQVLPALAISLGVLFLGWSIFTRVEATFVYHF